MYCNGITYIPHNIHYLSKIKQLYLQYNNIKIVPKNILKLEYLEILELSHNPIIKIPNFHNIKSISRIYLRNTSLYKLPYGIYKYTNDIEFLNFKFMNYYHKNLYRSYNKYKYLNILDTITYIQQLYKRYLFLIEFYSYY